MADCYEVIGERFLYILDFDGLRPDVEFLK